MVDHGQSAGVACPPSLATMARGVWVRKCRKLNLFMFIEQGEIYVFAGQVWIWVLFEIHVPEGSIDFIAAFPIKFGISGYLIFRDIHFVVIYPFAC